MGGIPEELKKLMEKRDQIHLEMETHAEFLASEGMPGLKGNLVDDEGFPRNDIDIYAVRTARHRIACLRTDLKEVNGQIEKVVFDLHSGRGAIHIPRGGSDGKKKKEESGFSSDESGDDGNTYWDSESENGWKAFAVIDEVTYGSPAEDAGLKEFDQILQIGELRRKAEKKKEEKENGKHDKNEESKKDHDKGETKNEGEGDSKKKGEEGKREDMHAEKNARNDKKSDESQSSHEYDVSEIFTLLPQQVIKFENKKLAFKIWREKNIIDIEVIPKKWEGRGLLGCHMKPLP